MSLFEGAGVALITPFTKDGEINYKKLAELIEYQIANKTDAIIAAGTTAESATLTREMLSDFLMTQWAAQVLPISLREQWILKRNGIQTINLLVFGNAQKKFMTGIQKSMKIQDLNQCPLALLQKMEI